MVTKPSTAPVTQSAPRVSNEIEVGEDLKFQRKWWRFENFAWILFTLIIVLDVAGLFGRGPIAKAERRSADRDRKPLGGNARTWSPGVSGRPGR